MTDRLKVACRLEKHLAGQAIVVSIRLTIMLLQTILIDEDLIARRTIPVADFVMVFQVTEVVEMIVAILTIRVVRTFKPVFFQPRPGRKVLRTILANVVIRRIGFMSIEGRPRSKQAVASLTVSHDVKRKDGWRGRCWGNKDDESNKKRVKLWIRVDVEMASITKNKGWTHGERVKLYALLHKSPIQFTLVGRVAQFGWFPNLAYPQQYFGLTSAHLVSNPVLTVNLICKCAIVICRLIRRNAHTSLSIIWAEYEHYQHGHWRL